MPTSPANKLRKKNKLSFARVGRVCHLKDGNFAVDGKNIFQNPLPEVVAVMTRTGVMSKYINKIHKYMFSQREIAFGDIYGVAGGES